MLPLLSQIRQIGFGRLFEEAVFSVDDEFIEAMYLSAAAGG